MQIERRPTVKNPPEWFTGDVWLDPVATPQSDGQQANAGIVRFAPGARTAWHSHPGGQTLHVIEGVAYVQARGGEIAEVPAGHTVVCPPDEEHWHGASPDSFMAHVAVWDELPGQPSAVWGEHVTDAEYSAR
ncbi:cupin domain-containing protein [Microbacterium sp. EYE_5]|uniref:(R)-mandelonitrile lyase n=1 Tax=unclassified Microbacterium TaxID=2609290 RepID=UPI00200397D7|nr:MULTISPECIES: cupin domain-containing protein [unclassified Microbacterium]MCK6081318.1 cupin domain-containing protein [Microbacterium sp. EYE_382]MCK6086588.1 cupin domain-containing protein [Microbacterium sp. EYE_384]MCK6123914.1 cupin domain-containing protein [Microbacterium sp. EYE_80]MCK6126823.1 cupin domain-containing protein [Microbacterium sp. EYE_79]MCK6142273.1 cupin domain-containing protein [Microbacterium sp. EYE_39]